MLSAPVYPVSKRESFPHTPYLRLVLPGTRLLSQLQFLQPVHSCYKAKVIHGKTSKFGGFAFHLLKLLGVQIQSPDRLGLRRGAFVEENGDMFGPGKGESGESIFEKRGFRVELAADEVKVSCC